MEFKSEIDNECAHHIKKKGEFCAPDAVVNKIKATIQDKSNYKNILSSLKNKYQCETEVCVLEKPEIKSIIGADVDSIILDNFKPKGPRNNNKWFSNYDIDDVLKQIQKKYTNKNFYHIPFTMIDFEKTGSELATLDWPKKYSEGYRCFGTVLNTDKHTGNGEHWFAIFASFQDDDEEFTIEYFNSSGELPMNEIVVWMKRVKHEWGPYFKEPILDICVTRIANQKDFWNCGSYSLYYNISRLDGIPHSYFKNNEIGDHNMQEFRKFLFRD
jgi:hypothetical protein